jgi:NitT/TauT family transport system substrate-binding protein
VLFGISTTDQEKHMKRVSIASCAAALICAAGLNAGSARAADSVTLQLDWVPSGIAAGWYYGVAQHCFSDQGIDVSIKRGYGAGDAITKIATGASEFGVTDLGAMIAGRAKTGAAVKGLLPIMPDSPFGVVVMDSGPIKTLKDLEGRSVASAPGDAGMQFLPIGMKIAGADFAKIKQISSEPATLAGLLIQGKVDALTSYVTSAMSIDQAAMQVGKKTRAIAFGQQLNIYNAALFTSDKLIAEHPDLVKRFYTGAACSYDKSQKNVDAALDAMVAQVSGMTRESQADLTVFSYKLAFDSPTFKQHGYKWYAPRVAHTVEIVREGQGITQEVDPASVVYEPN